MWRIMMLVYVYCYVQHICIVWHGLYDCRQRNVVVCDIIIIQVFAVFNILICCVWCGAYYSMLLWWHVYMMGMHVCMMCSSRQYMLLMSNVCVHMMYNEINNILIMCVRWMLTMLNIYIMLCIVMYHDVGNMYM